MGNVVLLGDSIFDNAVYVLENQSVTDHLGLILPPEIKVSLLAVDGAVTSQVAAQLNRLPPDSTHLFVSSGGNDALMAKDQIPNPDRDLEVLDVLEKLTILVNQFRNEYRHLLNEIEKLNLPTTVCTIYSSVPGLENKYKIALSAFNDVIIQEAAAKHFPIIELQQVCTDAKDYSAISPIEPSAAGGKKIAERISVVLKQHNFDTKYTTIY